MDEIKCKCGKTYLEKRHKLPVRDKDVSKCSCGEILREWNGGVMYSHTLIADGEATD